ncbi:MAG: hypothetical protein WBV69_07960 [Candidatus Sulfotelmatobacter sp.]
MMTLDSRICAIRIRLVNRCRQTGFLLLSVFFGLATGVAAGQAKPNGRSVSAPTVTFTLDFPQSDPTHYSIAVDESGHASYECTVKADEDSEPRAYRMEFEVTARTREHIFEWTKQAKFFSDKVDSGNRKLALTGEKQLSYQDGQRSTTARYNFSNLDPVRQLTALFQNMAGTLDYGRRLEYYHRYQKLALDEELKRMEEQARNNELSEIQGVAPVLQEILDDTSVINVARARAKELMQMASATAPGR